MSRDNGNNATHKKNGPNNKPVVEYAKELVQKGQCVQALRVLDEAGKNAHNVDGLYVRAVCYRQLKQSNAALQALELLHEMKPDHARAYQEIGHIHLAAGSKDKAIEGYAAAVAINPALIASWRALMPLYLDAGQPQNHQQAETHLRQLQQLPVELQAVKSFLHEGNLEMADTVCRHFMQNNKQHIEGMRLLAEIASQARIIDDAEFILESAVTFDPKHIGARVDYAAILLKRQRFEKAHQIAKQLCQEYPDNKQFQSLFAATELGVGDTESAVSRLSQLEKDAFNLQHTYLSLGHAYKTQGRFDEATNAYQKLYQFKADYGDAFWSLANTKTYRFTDAELQHMIDYESRESTSVVDRVHFCFALGKAYEDRKSYSQAFDYYERGNALNKQSSKVNSPAIEKRVERQKNVCTLEFFANKAAAGHSAPDPIFVVGLPRAGSTLLEQILASHSQIDGTLELPNILSLTRRLRGKGPAGPSIEPQYPKILAELDDDYFARFGEQYINDTRVFRQGAAYFIDKMPNNFLHIGLIKLILPNAKVIDARRHPMSCCFSGFKQLFAEGQDFSYELDDIGRYYRHYVDMMDHWDQVLPGFVLRVQHEDVIEDLEGQVRKMLEFCQLPFEQSCVDYYKTQRNVRTPSSEQVRQPIFKTAMEQWRHFDEHLQPLKDALGTDILQRYPIN